MAKTPKKRMTEQDKLDWDNLYEYVRSNVLGYDSNQSLSTKMTLRLKGLSSNKFVENNNIKDTANYSLKVVLNTFKFCMPVIKKSLHSVSFKNEEHKFNYILKIVEQNLNTVYMRMKKAEQSKIQTETIDVSVATHSGAGYQKKTKSTSNKKLDELW